jgi:hypothetical protein
LRGEEFYTDNRTNIKFDAAKLRDKDYQQNNIRNMNFKLKESVRFLFLF